MVLKRKEKVLERFHIMGMATKTSEAIITTTFPCRQTIMKHDMN